MQDCWTAKLSWDAELSDELAKKFLKLKRDLICVDNLTIPRRLVINLKERNNLSFHVFCDASQLAYATCIYLRSENEEGVSCQLVQSRSRVAPLKPVTVSRLELLACTIGIRLMTTIKRDLHMEDVTTFYWTDSMNALHWSRNEEDWGIFVMNRVREIRNYSSKGEWNHIPGTFNPADLPSRGCSAVTLLSQHWHDGPSWLKQDEKHWPVSEAVVDKEIINSEKKKTIVTLAVTKNEEFDYLANISSFEKIRIEDPVICDEGKGHNPSDSSSPVPVSQEIPAPVPVFQEATLPVPVFPEELLPTSQPRRINRYGRTLRAPHRLDL
ncbi:uncharacterized protein LOC129971970 [Argiope bruennichi]|uniref:uncharacterized protein LOC129971970 n=1 Tax=Argiope bruennichi TaxID=94029 RepID=UPI002494A873|nr:uncharacterized protein LOC129971970 [Argiope bruennichi]